MRTALRSAAVATLFSFAIRGALLACSSPSEDTIAAAASAAPAGPADELGGLAAFEPPPAPDRRMSELGRLLFFDPRLSGDRSMSCATCHDPRRAFSDGLARGRGRGGRELARNTPATLNLVGRDPYMWDGRAETLEEQALMPMSSDEEMAADLDRVLADLALVPEYAARFEMSFPGAGITRDTLSRAVAAFERGLVSGASLFDRYARGERGAMSEQAVAGLRLFVGKARCIKCHDGPLLTDNGFHDIGLRGSDAGRAKIVSAAPRGSFKTPSLRDVELTPPYFHDGSAPALDDVVAHYDRGGDVREGIDPDVRPLGLSAAERAALVAFLKALTGEVTPVEPPGLPRPMRFERTPPKELTTASTTLLATFEAMAREIEEGRWDELAAGIRTIEENAEILVEAGGASVPPAGQAELRRHFGRVLVELKDFEEIVRSRSQADARSAHERLRERCDDCHALRFRLIGR